MAFRTVSVGSPSHNLGDQWDSGTENIWAEFKVPFEWERAWFNAGRDLSRSSARGSIPDGLWRAQLSLLHSLDAQSELKRVQEEKNSQEDTRAKEVWISQGKDNHFKPKSLFPEEPGRPICLNSVSWVNYLTSAAPVPSFVNNPFLNNLPGFSWQSSHGWLMLSCSSLGLPVPLASPGEHF